MNNRKNVYTEVYTILQNLNEEEIVENRYAKFRNMGEFKEV